MRTFLIALAAVLIICIMVETNVFAEDSPEVFKAKDFALMDLLGGKDVRLSDYAGSPVVIYFFASW